MIKPFFRKYSFCIWLALFLHLLFLLSISIQWVLTNTVSQENYVPSYAYHESSAASYQAPAVQIKQSQPVSKQGLLKPILSTQNVKFNHAMDISSKTNGEPVHLIGDTHKTPKPLIILLGKALTAQLIYPKAAIDLTVRGMSVIGFVLHPDGTVTDLRLLRSSRANILDQAALNAAQHISPLKNAATYVKEPTPIVFGIVFGGVN